MSLEPLWVSMFADVGEADLPAATAFWSAVAGDVPDDPIGGGREFVSLRPQDGDPYLWLQRIGSGPPAWHHDLYVRDLPPATEIAVQLGATVVRTAPWWTTMRSPAGLEFCLVRDDRETHHRPEPRSWPHGHRSRADQVCLDIPPAAFDGECRFWAELTGWQLRDSPQPPFRYLVRPGSIPVRFLLQPLGPDDSGPVREHLDLATDDRSAETVRHRALGAELVRVTENWTTLRAPGGHIYCITDRSP